MRILLDTHTLILAMFSSRTLSAPAAAAIADESNTILVSAASAWEVATKVRLGKLPSAELLEQEFFERIAKAGYTLLSIDPGSALRAGRLSGDHGDPFDRILAAQALAEDIPIISNDAKLDLFQVRRIW